MRAADVAWLAAFISTANQNHDLPAVQSVINSQAGSEGDPQFKHTITDGFTVVKISGPHTRQTRVHRRLHPLVAEGIKPFVKRNQPVLKLQLLDFPLDHLQCNL